MLCWSGRLPPMIGPPFCTGCNQAVRRYRKRARVSSEGSSGDQVQARLAGGSLERDTDAEPYGQRATPEAEDPGKLGASADERRIGRGVRLTLRRSRSQAPGVSGIGEDGAGEAIEEQGQRRKRARDEREREAVLGGRGPGAGAAARPGREATYGQESARAAHLVQQRRETDAFAARSANGSRRGAGT